MTASPNQQPDDTPMHCLGCGYQLKHLPENRCPECGKPFDPDDDRTFAGKLIDARKYVWSAIGAGLATFTPLLVGWFNDQRPFGSPSIFGNLDFLVVLGPIGIIGGLIVAASIAKASWNDMKKSYCERHRRRYLILAFVLSMSVIGLMGFLTLGLPSRTTNCYQPIKRSPSAVSQPSVCMPSRCRPFQEESISIRSTNVSSWPGFQTTQNASTDASACV